MIINRKYRDKQVPKAPVWLWLSEFSAEHTGYLARGSHTDNLGVMDHSSPTAASRSSNTHRATPTHQIRAYLLSFS